MGFMLEDGVRFILDDGPVFILGDGVGFVLGDLVGFVFGLNCLWRSGFCLRDLKLCCKGIATKKKKCRNL